MPVTFVLGRAGTGKTHYCLDALLAELGREGAKSRLLFIVPEQASFQMERTLALRAPRGGYWRAEVLSFSRLAYQVIDETGPEPCTLSASARSLALRYIAGENEDALRAFGPSARTPGFFAQLNRLIEELLRENISPEQFAEASASLDNAATRRRTQALALVYREYIAWLGTARIDPVLRPTLLRRRLGGLEWLPEAMIWVDGFAGFTGQELETLVALAEAAREVAITLLLDPSATTALNAGRTPNVLGLFQRTETTYQRLRERLLDEGVELRPPLCLSPPVPPRFAEAEQLTRLEHGLAAPGPPVSVLRRQATAESPQGTTPTVATAQASQVRVVECRTHREELRAAARFIRRMVIESRGELHFRDFALIARNLEPFAREVADVFADYEIPVFLDRRRPLGAHALSRCVGSLLEALATDFPTNVVIRLFRCGLMPLTRDEAERLEIHLLTNEVHGFETWRRRWTSAQEEMDGLDDARGRIAGALEPLVLATQAGAPPAANDWARLLYDALDQLDVPRTIASWIADAQRRNEWETAEIHRLAWSALCETLDDLHDLLGTRGMMLADVAAIVGGSLRDRSVGLAPPTLDQVLVGSIERSRHPDIKYAWLFALNEGVFPDSPHEDALLSAADRTLLIEAGLDAPRPRRDEAFAERMLAYIALTRPSHGLTISYAAVDSAGQRAFPSPLLEGIRRALPEIEIEKPANGTPPVCLVELAGGYLDARAALATGTDGNAAGAARKWRRYRGLRERLRSATELSAGLDRLLSGELYSNKPHPLIGYARRQSDGSEGVWSGSASQLETYLKCPFKHFARYGLSVDALRGPKPMAIELGSRAHEVLAAVVDRAVAAARPVSEIDDAQWLRWLDEVLAEPTTRQTEDIQRRRPRAALLIRFLRSFLTEVVLAHAERWRRGEFEPLACERFFIPGAEPPALDALDLEIGGGRRVHLRGFIDRIDCCRSEDGADLLVYDYKSSAGTVGGNYLTQDRLQLFAYLLAVRQALATDTRTRVAGAFLAPLYPRMSAADTKYYAAAAEAEARMFLYCPRGLFNEEVARRIDRDLSDKPSPTAQMRLKKDGTFYSSSDARPEEDLEQYLDLARRTITQAAVGILDGCIDIAPLIEKKTLACRQCDFAPVCRFEPGVNRPRVAEKNLPLLRRDAEHD